jgi:hypothetical protein
LLRDFAQSETLIGEKREACAAGTSQASSGELRRWRPLGLFPVLSVSVASASRWVLATETAFSNATALPWSH